VKRSNLFFLLFALALAVTVSASAVDQVLEQGGKRYVLLDDGWVVEGKDRTFPVVADQLTLQFKAGVDPARQEALIGSFGLEVIRRNPLGFIHLRVAAGEHSLTVAGRLLRHDDVADAWPVTEGRYWSNDTYFSQQWPLENDGGGGGVVDADIDAPEAWAVTTGDPNLLVASLDSGLDYRHNDLGPNIWQNLGEDFDGDGMTLFHNGSEWQHDPGDINGVDDDGNGATDDLAGWNIDGDNHDTSEPWFFYHGTHVMGTYGARTNNGLDVAGIAGGWGSQSGSKILAVTMGITPTTAELADAIVYAVDNGARVITMSLGVDETSGINTALNYAAANDVFVDCASGNDYGSVSYPARNPNVMAVGASDNQDQIAGFSNHGPEIEVAAPGVNIGSTAPNQGQSFMDGTSMAAPHVAGVAALVFSVNPTLTGAEVRQIIMDTAEDKGAAGWDQYFGHGRINAYDAVMAAGSPGTDTVSVDLDCTPGSGVVPFTEQFQVGVTNLYAGFSRTDHVTLGVLTAGGMNISNWKSGTVNIGPGATFSTGFNATIPAAGTVIGDNTFTLTAVDVTAAPYNQPPYPASGDTDVTSCTVTGIAP